MTEIVGFVGMSHSPFATLLPPTMTNIDVQKLLDSCECTSRS